MNKFSYFQVIRFNNGNNISNDTIIFYEKRSLPMKSFVKISTKNSIENFANHRDHYHNKLIKTNL